MVTGLWTNTDIGGVTTEAMASEAYQYADALLAARQAGEQA